MKIYSIFPSIDGECNYYGQGRTTTFIRFAGCNLNCKFPPDGVCDTPYALSMDSGKEMSVDEIMGQIKEIGLKKVTITGGEPLLQREGLEALIKKLWHLNYKTSVETNGSLVLPKHDYFVNSWVVDYKLPSTGQAEKMLEEEMNRLLPQDFVKFVVSNREDYEYALLAKKRLEGKDYVGCMAQFAFSPTFGALEPDILAGWLIKDRVEAVLNVQLHKLINLKEKM